MLAYIARRILLMIPTLFGILALSFLIVQFAPGGPVERVLAQIAGPGHGRDRAFRRRQQRHRRRAGRRGLGIFRQISRRPGPRPQIHRRAGKAIRLRQAAAGALLADDPQLRDVRFRPLLFPRRAGAVADQGKAAGVDVARPVDDLPVLYDLDSAGHRQGAPRGRGFRHLDLGASSSSATPFRAFSSPSC